MPLHEDYRYDLIRVRQNFTKSLLLETLAQLRIKMSVTSLTNPLEVIDEFEAEILKEME